MTVGADVGFTVDGDAVESGLDVVGGCEREGGSEDLYIHAVIQHFNSTNCLLPWGKVRCTSRALKRDGTSWH